MYQVLIVEDQEMTRRFFELIIRNSENYDCAGSLANAAMAAMFCEKTHVDLILMDVMTAFRNSGLEAAEAIKKKMPGIKIIIVTSMPEFSWLQRAKEIGVDSFWYKDAGEDALISLMDRTMAGEHIYPDRTPEIFLGAASSREFSERELETLKEVISGDSNTEIAERMHVSVSTVKAHIQSLMEKTGLHSRAALAVEAAACGIVVRTSEHDEK